MSPNSKIAPTLHGNRLTKCEAMTADDQGSIYMGGLELPNLIYKWNISNSMNSNNLKIIVSNLNISWINSMWIDNGYLWITNNRYF